MSGPRLGGLGGIDRRGGVLVADPGDRVVSTTPVDHPLALLPVRIETAFVGSSLLVRVYPDEIHVDRGPPPAPGEQPPAARPRLLPDRWIVAGWRDGVRRFLVEGPAIDEAGLRLSPDLTAAAPAAAMAWLRDFAEAERVGMALRIEVDESRLDRLIVFGVRSSLTPDAGAQALAELLAAHAARGAFAFIAPGTPTNQVGPAARAEPAPVGEPAGRADARTAAALGLAAAPVLSAAPGANRDDETIARAMNTAVWPATWGYFLPHLMPGEPGDPAGPTISPAAVDAARAHFIAYVRAGGPLPALRIGPQPYGVLPATSLEGFVPAAGDPTGVLDVVRRLAPTWRGAARSIDPDTADASAVLDLLAVQPTSHGFDARAIIGRRTIANLFAYLAAPDYPAWTAAQEPLGTEVLRAVGLAWRPRIAHAQPEPASFALGAPLVEAPVVRRPGIVLDTVLGRAPINYLEWLRDADVHALRTQVGTPRPPPPVVSGALAMVARPRDCLLWAVLRHATLRVHADVGLRIAGGFAPEPELVDVIRKSATIWTVFDRPAPPTGGATLAAYLHAAANADTAALVEHRAALTALSHQPAAALARHFTGALDLCAYRLDAWMTSLATRRLAVLRASRPTGVHVGAYGWVEDLRPRAARPSEGHIHAPSLAHATTAAILRGGYRARRLAGQDAGALAVDLSSARVRAAAWTLDGVRRGIPLAALLGHRFERALHDHDPPLDDFVDAFRAIAPAADGSIVDGRELVRKWRDGELATFAWGAHQTELEAALGATADAIDAIGDAMLAEGAHQLVRGNPEAAAATFDALGRGDQAPPELSVIRTPRPAIHHTARVVVVLRPEPPADSPDWPPARFAARAAAAPPLEAWARRALGPATAAVARIEWRDDNGGVVDGGPLTIAGLGLSALDVVYLVDELDAWCACHARAHRPAGVGPDARPLVVAHRALLELRAVARGLRRVLLASRPATGERFVSNDATSSPPVAEPEIVAAAGAARAVLVARADAAEAALSADAGAVRDALAALAAFAIPTDFAGPDAGLRDRAGAAIGAARARVAEAAAADGAHAALAALFAAAIPAPATIEVDAAARAAFARRASADPLPIADWLGAIGRVRAAVGELDAAALLARALGRAGGLAYAQLPDIAGEPAVYEPAVLDRARTAIVAYLPDDAPLDRVAVLAIDEWIEAVPVAAQTSAVAFHYDRPDAQPPQAILLAVPPDLAAPWTVDAIEAVVRETIDLAAIRSVPPEALGRLAQVLPATALAFNPAGDTISTDLTAFAD